jgi:lipopolysaccharide transport system ATP-binding protein
MAAAILAEGLAKSYALTGRPTSSLREALSDGLRRMLGRRREADAPGDFWALRDVSFSLEAGDRLGIVGRNGAGKSTLLKILARITEPTAGRATTRGRVASLLEVGTGFHPELTGRENIYLNGAVLGMPRAEVRRRFDEIVAFAETGRFLDVPVKRYSSGMHMRLAFAVAAHLEPEILIVDEVLAVGDAQFQEKCLGKMREVASGGRTVVFVSHSPQAIAALTTKALHLKEGRVEAFGPTSEVLAGYLRRDGAVGTSYVAPESAGGEPGVRRVELRSSAPDGCHVAGEPAEIVCELSVPGPLRGAAVAIQLLDAAQRPIVHLLTLDAEQPLCRAAGTYRLTCRIPRLRLYVGRYSLTVHFAEARGGRKFSTLEGICPFEVIAPAQLREHFWEPGTCAYLEECAWTVEPR